MGQGRSRLEDVSAAQHPDSVDAHYFVETDNDSMEMGSLAQAVSLKAVLSIVDQTCIA